MPHISAVWPLLSSLQVGMGQMECYERDFEEFMLKVGATFATDKKLGISWLGCGTGGVCAQGGSVAGVWLGCGV